MVTYSDFIQFCIFIVSLISLIHQIYEDRQRAARFASHSYVKKIAAITCNNDG